MPIKNIMRTKLYPLTPEFLLEDWTADHRRWSCYRHWGVQCCVPGCNRVGTHVLHWYSPGDFKKYGDSGLGEHIDLIGHENGSEFLMTVDHVIPKSYGGPKIWWNLQPMCATHNNNQKNRMVHLPSRPQLELIAFNSSITVPTYLPDREFYDYIAQQYRDRQTGYPKGKGRGKKVA